MRNADTYRGARRAEARSKGLFWRGLDLISTTRGEKKVAYPFQKSGKEPGPGRPPFGESGERIGTEKYNTPELRRLRAERGVGSPNRIAEEVRAAFKKTKRV